MRQLLSIFFALTLICMVACNTQKSGVNKDAEATKLKQSTPPPPNLNQTKETRSPVQHNSYVTPDRDRTKEFNYGFPVIPGFTPTGDKAVDEANYGQAKAAFFEKYPDDYAQRIQKLTDEGKAKWEQEQQNNGDGE